MARPEKETAVAEIKDSIQNNTVAIISKYQGITVAQVTELRNKLREQGVTYKVYKNNLAKRALDELGLSDAVMYMDGPTAWAFCEDPVAPAKVLKEFGKDVKVVVMQGGILEGAAVGADKLDQLADLPSRDQLLSQVVGTIAMPLRKFLGTLQAVPRDFVNVVDQIKKKQEGE